jgi:putative ABC transport system ATP-binding protein
MKEKLFFLTFAAQTIQYMEKKTDAIIDVQTVTKTYDVSHGKFAALKNISLQIAKGQLVAITGKSGSGKTTLLNIIAGIDRPDNGQVLINSFAIQSLSESELAKWRGKNIGVVFQFYQLLPTLTVLENVMLPMDFCNTFPKKERKERALELLNKVGVLDQADKLPNALSGGQPQRVAIARALANDPPVIVADEPTGNLDTQTANAIFEIFMQLSQAGKTVVVITHEKEFTKYFEAMIAIEDGEIVNALAFTHQQTITDATT